MAEASGTLHEPEERLSEATIDRHRAIMSLVEELEAADWYDQRVEATHDVELRLILAHNRDEELEHAAMVLEWLRRRTAAIDRKLRAKLFTSGPIHEDAPESTNTEAAVRPALSDGSLGIGSLKEKRSWTG